jgi:hypothetical protein
MIRVLVVQPTRRICVYQRLEAQKIFRRLDLLVLCLVGAQSAAETSGGRGAVIRIEPAA